jgi:hypothetical protein
MFDNRHAIYGAKDRYRALAKEAHNHRLVDEAKGQNTGRNLRFRISTSRLAHVLSRTRKHPLKAGSASPLSVQGLRRSRMRFSGQPSREALKQECGMLASESCELPEPLQRHELSKQIP